VTGADGFIGSHLVERLIADGADVRAFCLYNSNGSAGWLDDSKIFRDSGSEPLLADIRDPEAVRHAVAGVDIVFHLAALIAIPYSYLAPRSFVDTNVSGTLNVLEAVRREGVTKMINTSTSEVYGTPETVPITEAHPLRGQSPYSATKIAADKLCESYALSFGTPVTILRPYNTFGPRQSARAVIPTILSQLLAGARTIRLGAVTPRRDFTFVADTCDGFVRAAAADLEPGTVVQLGTGRTVSIGETFDLCRSVLGVDAEVVTDEQRVRPAGSEVEILQSDPSLAQSLLGWTPQVSLEDGLARTAEWLRPRVDPTLAGRYQR
jgi:NAD dependent epimerase/dehydratase